MGDAALLGYARGIPRVPRGRCLPGGGLALWLALLLLSCNSLAPTAPTPLLHTKSATLETLFPQWQPFAPALSAGMDYCEGSIQYPKLRFWALRVDLTESALGIVVNAGAAGHIPSTKVSSFVRRYGCLAGINTNPFSPVSGKEGEDRIIMGISVSQGRVLAPPRPNYDSLVFYRDGRAAILSQGDLSPEDMDTIENAVGGFYAVLRDGEVLEGAFSRGNARHPRSAVGLSADGRLLYLLVIDGRQLGSIGATEAEVGILLQKLGAAAGLNLDG
ncbi:MAG: phosphodiester glycosidase family protein, partial [Spirochaetaceae bacterium]|nr:phosphodiester glycosidase family protein [Spirochaetaceae bacterium]